MLKRGRSSPDVNPSSPVTEALKRMSLAPPATPGELRLRSDVAEVLLTSHLVRLRESARRPLEVYVELLCESETTTNPNRTITLLCVNIIVEKYYPHHPPLVTLVGTCPWDGNSASSAAVCAAARAELARNASCGETPTVTHGVRRSALAPPPPPPLAHLPTAAATPITLAILNAWSCVFSLRLVLAELRATALSTAAKSDDMGL